MQLHKRRLGGSNSNGRAWLLKYGPTAAISLAVLIYTWCFVLLDNDPIASFGLSASNDQSLNADGLPHVAIIDGQELLQQQKGSAQLQSYYPPYSSKPNAIIYMAQKSHKVYLRNSLALLERSLDLLFQNYLLLNDQYLNATVFIFHTGDFDKSDLQGWEERYPAKTKGTIQLVDLLNTPYWQVPDWMDEDDLPNWRNPEFNIGYRHMIRWYAIRMWDYFAEINRVMGTKYRYVMRMDEESFFHSPIDYDLFDYMASHEYQYSFRICSYEMNAIQQIMHNYTTQAKNMWGQDWVRNRHFNGANCGFYNNWFIGSVDFFAKDEKVQHYLKWLDQEGYMYRDRLNDLVIQTGAIYLFCPEERIHRFLDWSYEHFTLTKQGCPKWGALATGYNDENANATIASFLEDLEAANCTMDPMAMKRQIPGLHMNYNTVRDLSPTYNHLSQDMQNITLISIKAGRVDLPGRGERSGRR